MRTFTLAAALFMAALYPCIVQAADDLDLRLKKLETEMGLQVDTINTQQKTIDELKESLNQKYPAETQSTEENAAKLTGLFGGSLMSNLNNKKQSKFRHNGKEAQCSK